MSRRGKGGFHRRTPHRRSAVCCSWLCGMHGGPAGDYWSSALAVTATEGKKAVSASPPAVLRHATMARNAAPAGRTQLVLISSLLGGLAICSAGRIY